MPDLRDCRGRAPGGDRKGIHMLAKTPRPNATFVEASDGVRVPIRVFEPPGRARGTVLIAGGTGIRQTYYAPFADHLAGGGYRAITFDYRGIGEARPASLRGVAADLVDWARLDARAVHRFARGLDAP